MKLEGIEIVADEVVGEGGFLAVRRMRLRNRRADGSKSAEYLCDYTTRRGGLDAVAVVMWRRCGESVEILLRACLRPAVSLSSGGSLFLWEVVAGLLEAEDEDSWAGVSDRAAIEVLEETGYQVERANVVELGAPFYASPGSLGQKVYPCHVEIALDATAAVPEGDGSPMEEAAELRWVALDAAIDECVTGTIEDVKTEVLLRRLRDRLHTANPPR